MPDRTGPECLRRSLDESPYRPCRCARIGTVQGGVAEGFVTMYEVLPQQIGARRRREEIPKPWARKSGGPEFRLKLSSVQRLARLGTTKGRKSWRQTAFRVLPWMPPYVTFDNYFIEIGLLRPTICLRVGSTD